MAYLVSRFARPIRRRLAGIARRLPLLLILASVPVAAWGGDCVAARGPSGKSVDADYAVVVSSQTLHDPEWRQVVDLLTAKHHAVVVSYRGGSGEWLAPLRALSPKYACFVARPEELGLEALLDIQRRTRQLDDDPYSDVVWGIVTGSSAARAKRLVEVSEPLRCSRGLAGDRMDLGPFQEGVWFYEGAHALARQKRDGGAEVPLDCTLDNAHQLVDIISRMSPEYIQTSGHANPQRWNIGYGCDRGRFSARDGVLYGVNVAGIEKAVEAPTAKIYLPYRNCLVGLVENKDALALGWLGSAGVRQMAGYIVTTWNGIAGNGLRKWLFDRPGEYSYSEAFYFNQQLIMHGLSPHARTRNIPAAQYRHGRLRDIAAELHANDARAAGRDELAALWDRDAMVFYGDPAWDARMKPSAELPQWSVEVHDGVYSIRVTAATAGTVSRYLLWPHRVRPTEWLQGKTNVGMLCDKFVQVSASVPKGTTTVVRFRGERLSAARPVKMAEGERGEER